MTPGPLRTVLAHRIRVQADACDALRALKPYTPEEYRNVGQGLEVALAVLDELERIWAAVYGERPSMLDVADAIP